MTTQLYEVPVVKRRLSGGYERTVLQELTRKDVMDLLSSDHYLWIGKPRTMAYCLEDKADYCNQFGSE
jgi:hypothetical protein